VFKILKSLTQITAISLIVFACGGNPNVKPEGTADLPNLEPTPAPVEVVEIPSTAPKTVTPKTETEPKTANLEAPSKPIIVDDDPQQFIDLDIFELSKLLGAPLLVRRDGTAEVWQYQGDSCILDVFLYEKNSKLQVKFVDLRGNADDSSNRACMAEILRQHIRHMS